MRQAAIDIARKAGRYLNTNFRQNETIYGKRGASKEIVTKYDNASDKLILDELKHRFPEHSYLTEESGLIDNGSEYLWIVDPMDGSSNYASGNPFFSISIALARNNKVILGVVYAPYLDELYVAEKGKGAFLNDKQINVSDISDMSKAYIVTCEGGDTNARLAELYKRIYPDVKDMRKIGSAAIEGGFVASGRAEAHVTLMINSWDVAASVLITTEAGGKATDFEGNPWTVEKNDLLLSNGKIHETLLKEIKKD